MKPAPVFTTVSCLLLVSLLISACQPIQPVRTQTAASAAINEVTFVATEYTLTGPDSVPAGWTHWRLQNQGKEFHNGQLNKLDEGKTMQDLLTALQTDPTHVPSWLQLIGGVGAQPGDELAAFVNLEPGNYVILCGVADSKGVPHFAHGMVRPFTVTAATATAAPPPADVTVELFDFNFALSPAITAGEHTMKVTNKGPQPHEVAVVQLNPGATAQQFLEAVHANAPWPGKLIGGLMTITPGKEGYFTAKFAPGDYALLCFWPDAESGMPHFAKGMVQQITVR